VGALTKGLAAFCQNGLVTKIGRREAGEMPFERKISQEKNRARKERPRFLGQGGRLVKSPVSKRGLGWG
jgi:hypothetical protein